MERAGYPPAPNTQALTGGSTANASLKPRRPSAAIWMYGPPATNRPKPPSPMGLQIRKIEARAACGASRLLRRPKQANGAVRASKWI